VVVWGANIYFSPDLLMLTCRRTLLICPLAPFVCSFCFFKIKFGDSKKKKKNKKKKEKEKIWWERDTEI
jgi:hypothetical protein